MLGASRGGMMTYIAIKEGAPLNAAATIAAPADLRQSYYEREDDMRRVYQELVGGAPEDVPEEFIYRSAIEWPEEINVPLLMIHGTADWRVDVSHSQNLADALGELNKKFKLVMYEGDDHGISQNWEDAQAIIFNWFEDHIDRLQ